MVLKILLAIGVLIAAVLLFALTKPSTFHAEKSITIDAPPDKVYALLCDFHNWPKWAPQDREDPTMQRTYSGETAGSGAVSEWTSKGSAGAGRMTITAADPSEVDVSVDWARPFRVRNKHGFRLTPVPGGIRVTWTAEGPNLYIMKLMEVFVGIDGLMGKHLQAGLENLKRVAEESK
jgi:uncharacterized protein YndB with AHSA1/START domain